MQIPYLHTHHFVPISMDDTELGLTIRSRCNDRYTEHDTGDLDRMYPGCGIEEEKMFDGERRIQRVRYRWGGMWFDPIDLYRLTPLPVLPCVKCHGSGEIALSRCSDCSGVGMVDADTEGAIIAPNMVQQN